jgi:hypothetical protein
VTATPEPQTFEEAVARFKGFLRQNGYSANLIWVEPSDLLLSGRRIIYVKLPVSAGNLNSARTRFATGMSAGIGVTFGTICELQNATCCYAWTPNDHTEKETHLMGDGLKLSVRIGTPRITGTPIRSWAHWQILKIRYRQYSNLNQQLFG